jgi:hypothetical protein
MSAATCLLALHMAVAVRQARRRRLMPEVSMGKHSNAIRPGLAASPALSVASPGRAWRTPYLDRLSWLFGGATEEAPRKPACAARNRHTGVTSGA